MERVFRAALSELGSHVGCADGPITGGKFLASEAAWLGAVDLELM